MTTNEFFDELVAIHRKPDPIDFTKEFTTRMFYQATKLNKSTADELLNDLVSEGVLSVRKGTDPDTGQIMNAYQQATEDEAEQARQHLSIEEQEEQLLLQEEKDRSNPQR